MSTSSLRRYTMHPKTCLRILECASASYLWKVALDFYTVQRVEVVESLATHPKPVFPQLQFRRFKPFLVCATQRLVMNRSREHHLTV